MNRRSLLTAAGATAAVTLAGPEIAAARQKVSRRGVWTEFRNLRIMEQYVENILTGDGAANAEFKSPDMTVTTPDALPYGGTIPDAEYGPALFSTFSPSPDQQADDPELFADADRVFLLGTFAATATATGRSFSTPLLEVFTLADGLIVNDAIFYFALDRVLAALADE